VREQIAVGVVVNPRHPQHHCLRAAGRSAPD
jgi:hypothetical protein